jgi:hypothetical protein
MFTRCYSSSGITRRAVGALATLLPDQTATARSVLALMERSTVVKPTAVPLAATAKILQPSMPLLSKLQILLSLQT